MSAESFVVLGAVVLAVTGAEALYADMGHFGKAAGAHRLVRAGGAGAGAELLRPGRAAACCNPEAVQNPFFLLLPGWALYPMVGARHRRDA